VINLFLRKEYDIHLIKMAETGQCSDAAKTSDFYHTDANLPPRFNNPDWFQGYENKKENPMYMTTNARYGKLPPTVHEMPVAFHGKSQQFSKHLGVCGMYRHKGFNTAIDKSKVPDF